MLKKAPSSTEIENFHSLVMNKWTPAAKKNMIRLDDTIVSKVLLKHSQDRNIHGKIFGGLLMRESVELAFVCASKNSEGCIPRIFNIDDIHFLRPVDVGSIVEYTAKINYAKGTMVNVIVNVTKLV